MSSAWDLFVLTLKVIGPVFFLGLQGSSVATGYEMNKLKSVRQYSFVPFASLFTNSVVWAYYGALKNDPTVLAPNVCGIISGGLCMYIYLKYSPRFQWKPFMVVMALVFIATYLFSIEDINLLGSVGCLLSISVMGSPLATLATVVRDKSTSSMPFLTSLACWLNSLSWSAYGLIVAHDVMIYGPNLIGCALTSAQMTLYFVYGMPRAYDDQDEKVSDLDYRL